jgi:hypothetical protein
VDTRVRGGLRRRIGGLAFAGLLAVVLLSGAGRAADEDCVPWPGEFSPLPTVHDPDPFAARWAQLRGQALAQRARDLEDADRVEANRLWRRVLCLDPESDSARAGVERTRPQVVRRGDTLATLVLAELDSSLARAERLIFDARFRDAMEELAALRARLEELGTSPELADRRVRLEVLAATALVAFGDEGAARERLEHALAADPGLRLDAGSTPPKLRRAFEAVRLARQGDGR